MKTFALVVGLAFMVACVPSPVATPSPSPSDRSPSPIASPTGSPVAGCLLPGNPAAHVYNPNRLQILNPCATVTGTIVLARREADGDFHIQLRVDASSLDPKGGHWINAKNTAAQGGNLILEPTCENPVTQADAVAACQGYHNPLIIPAIGTHVVVTGPWVMDSVHGWLEIHPITSLIVR